jgi:hypothetical protein
VLWESGWDGSASAAGAYYLAANGTRRVSPADFLAFAGRSGSLAAYAGGEDGRLGLVPADGPAEEGGHLPHQRAVVCVTPLACLGLVPSCACVCGGRSRDSASLFRVPFCY